MARRAQPSSRAQPARALTVARAAAMILAGSALSCASSEEDACLDMEGARAVYDSAGTYVGCCWPGDSPFSDLCAYGPGRCGPGCSVGPFVPPGLV